MCELLRANLYEFQKYNRESGDAPYFTLRARPSPSRARFGTAPCDMSAYSRCPE